MSNNDNRPVRVTGQERRHPAIRILARAAIELARQKLERERQVAANETEAPVPAADGGSSEEVPRG